MEVEELSNNIRIVIDRLGQSVIREKKFVYAIRDLCAFEDPIYLRAIDLVYKNHIVDIITKSSKRKVYKVIRNQSLLMHRLDNGIGRDVIETVLTAFAIALDIININDFRSHNDNKIGEKFSLERIFKSLQSIDGNLILINVRFLLFSVFGDFILSYLLWNYWWPFFCIIVYLGCLFIFLISDIIHIFHIRNKRKFSKLENSIYFAIYLISICKSTFIWIYFLVNYDATIISYIICISVVYFWIIFFKDIFVEMLKKIGIMDFEKYLTSLFMDLILINMSSFNRKIKIFFDKIGDVLSLKVFVTLFFVYGIVDYNCMLFPDFNGTFIEFISFVKKFMVDTYEAIVWTVHNLYTAVGDTISQMKHWRR